MSISTTKAVSQSARKTVGVNLVPSLCVSAVAVTYVLINIWIFSFFTDVSPLWIFDFTALIFILVLLSFVGFELFLGCIRFFWRMTFTENATIDDLFYYFSSAERYCKALRAFVVLVTKLILYALCSFAPMILISIFNASWFAFITNSVTTPVWASGLAYISAYFEVFGWFIFGILTLRLYPYIFILIVDNRITALEAAHISVLLSRNHLPYFVKLCIRNIGWLISSLLVLPAFYAIPYLICCVCIHSRQIFDSYNSSLITPNFDSRMY